MSTTFPSRARIILIACGVVLLALPLAAQDVSGGDPHRLTAPTSKTCELRVERKDPLDPSESCWSLACQGKRTTKIGCGVTALSEVGEISVSPDRKWLAVVSVGEGHPMLEVVDLLRFTEVHVYEPLTTVNPYPGTINLAGWETHTLLVSSEMPLDLLPLAKGEVESAMLEEPLVYRIAVPGWKITASPARH
ncbi:MAG: hypothetical protein ABJC13_00430 [Acidobacteriota bacterium]